MPERNQSDSGMGARSSNGSEGENNREGRNGSNDSQSNGSRRGRGFASMDRERQREIASKGGRAAHSKGTAHEWTPEEAREAGRKGGTAVSRDRAHMSAIGREGGASSHRRSRRGGMSDGNSRNNE
jgi:uncharacterized protein